MATSNFKTNGKFNYIEPNYVGKYNDEPVSLEDLSVYVELKVEYNRTNFVKYSQNDIFKEKGEPIYLRYVSKGNKNDRLVSIYNGVKVNGGNDVFLTTEGYDNYTVHGLNDVSTNELFGIESIDISYNNFMVPEVSIKFVDIKGASLFGAQELVRDEDGNKNPTLIDKFLSCFFTVPYPRFELYVKGFYGKPLFYDLSLVDFRSSFNASTGNYNVSVKFVGYSYALISDVNICSLIAAPTSHYYGRQFWEDNKGDKFNVDGIPMPTLNDIIKIWNSNLSKINEESEKDEALSKNLTELQNKHINYSQLNRELGKFMTTYCQTLESGVTKGSIACKTFYDVQTNKIIAIFEEVYNDESIAPISGSIESFFNSYIEKFNAMGSEVFKWENIKNKKWETKDLYTSNLSSLTSLIIDGIKKECQQKCNDFCKDNNISNNIQLQINDFIKNYKNFGKGTDNNDLNNLRQIGVFDMSQPINEAKKMYDENYAKLQEAQQSSESKLNKQITNILGFRPTLANMTKICFAHLETFLHMFEMVKQNTVQTTKDFVFPEMIETVVSKNNKKALVEGWFGKICPDRDEVKMVRGIISGIKDVKEQVQQSLSPSRTSANHMVFQRIAISDIFKTENPFFRQNIINDNYNANNIIIQRIVDLFVLGLHRSDFNVETAQNIGALDAQNYKDVHQRPSDALLLKINQKYWSGEFWKQIEIAYKAIITSTTQSVKEDKDNEILNKINNDFLNFETVLPKEKVKNDNGSEYFKIIDDWESCKNIVFYSNGQMISLNLSDGWANTSLFNFNKYFNDKTCYVVPRATGDYLNKLQKGELQFTKDADAMLSSQSGAYCHSGMKNDNYTLLTIPNVIDTWFGDRTQDLQNFLFASNPYDSFNNIYVKGILFLASFNWGDGGDDSLMNLINKTLLYDGFWVGEGKDLVEAVPYFYLLLLGGIRYGYDNNLQRVYEYCGTLDAIKYLKPQYGEKLKNYFTQWVEKYYKKWDSEIVKEVQRCKQIHENDFTKMVDISQLFYVVEEVSHDTKYPKYRRFFFNETHPIVQEMTQQLFKMVILYKNSPSLLLYQDGEKEYAFCTMENVIVSTIKDSIQNEDNKKNLNDIVRKYYVSQNHLCDKFKVQAYLKGFQAKLEELYNSTLSSQNVNAFEGSNAEETLEFNIYRYLKQLWDRWIVSEKQDVNNWELQNVMNNKIHFIDAAYNKVGDLVLVNMGKFVDLVQSNILNSNADMPFLSFLSYMYQENNCMLHNVQNFLNTTNDSEIRELFTPMHHTAISWNNVKQFSDLVVMYSYQPASSDNDEFNIDEEETDLPPQYTMGDLNDDLHIPAFGVTYGMQNQNYFTDIDVSMNTPNVTDQSIKISVQIAEENSKSAASDTQTKIQSLGQDLYQVYSSHAYQCTVTMMGCAWIQPLMYFQLNNVPMFHGAYIIHKVTHSITPNNMVTRFVGTKVSRKEMRKIETNLYINRKELIQQKYNITEASIAQVVNNCPYAFFPLKNNENLSLDNILNLMNETCQATQSLKNVVLKYDEQFDTKALLSIENTVEPTIKSIIFDMILQTYSVYFKSITWVVTDENSGFDMWKYIGLVLNDGITNQNAFEVKVGYVKESDKKQMKFNIINDYKNLNESFYISILKKYNAQKNSLGKFSYIDKSVIECKNFTELTSKSEDLIKKVCDFLNNEGEFSGNSGSYANIEIIECNAAVEQVVEDKWQEELKNNNNATMGYNFYGPSDAKKEQFLAEEKDQIVKLLEDKGFATINDANEALGVQMVNQCKPKDAKGGECAKYVRLGLEKALGMHTEGRPHAACRYWQILEWWGFTRIYYGMTKEYTGGYEDGDIIVTAGKADGVRDNLWGHIQVYYGGKWYADKQFNNANVYCRGGDRPSYIYRISLPQSGA